MSEQSTEDLIRQGIAAAEQGNTVVALVHLEDALQKKDDPIAKSYLGLCLAKERRALQKGVALCKEAIGEKPRDPTAYLNLGRIYLLAGQKGHAIRSFRKGLKLGRNPTIIEELKRLGLRKPPVIASLDRDHPLNKHLGRLFQRLGLR